MALRRKLLHRSAVVATLASTAAVASALALVTAWMLRVLPDRVAPLMTKAVSEADLAACTADPAGFRRVLSPQVELRATDPLALAAGRAPWVSAAGARSILSGRPSGLELVFGLGSGGGVVWARRAPSGPCSVILGRWRVPFWVRAEILFGGLGLAAAFSLGVTVLGFRSVLRDLLARIERLALAARGVGSTPRLPPCDEGAEDELGAVARALDEADRRIRGDADALARRAEAIERHLAHTAHDLLTPLTSLRLNLEALPVPLDAGAAQALGRALEDAEYLSALTDNLAVETRLKEELGASIRVPMDLGDLVDRACRRIEPQAARAGIEVVASVPDTPLVLPCHPTFVERMVMNIVANAVVHGREGGHVAVLLERRGAAFHLQVADDGPGVAPDLLSRLPERGFQGRQARSGRGAGLGLSIVAEVCRRQGWELRFDSDAITGLRVAVAGPVPEEGAGEAELPEASPPGRD